MFLKPLLKEHNIKCETPVTRKQSKSSGYALILNLLLLSAYSSFNNTQPLLAFCFKFFMPPVAASGQSTVILARELFVFFHNILDETISIFHKKNLANYSATDYNFCSFTNILHLTASYHFLILLTLTSIILPNARHLYISTKIIWYLYCRYAENLIMPENQQSLQALWQIQRYWP